MANFNDESSIESGYFGEVPSENPLVKLGVIDSSTPELTGLSKSISTQINTVKEEDKSLFDRFSETFKKRGDAGAGILTRGVEGDTSAVEGGLLMGANFLGALGDLAGDVITEGFTEFTTEKFQTSLQEKIQSLSETKPGEFVVSKLTEAKDDLDTLKELDPVVGARFQGGLDILDAAIVGITGGTAVVGSKLAREGAEVGVKKITEGVGEVISKAGDLIPTKPKGDKLLEKLNLETEKGIVGGKEVDISKLKKGVVEKISTPLREKNTKVLAGRALSPRTVGKSAKQKLESIRNVEINANKFYENVRTGVLKGDIDTIENAAQTVIDNIDIVGARIGNAVKKIEGNMTIDREVIDSINSAINAKGSVVSPATTVLKNLRDDIGDGVMTFSEAFELKKAYSNEVSKLYKSGDAGTKQYKALSDSVKFLNTRIDDIIKTGLGDEFKIDKEIFGNLKTIVDDLVASTLVEGRRSPNTFAEQLGMIEGLLSPIATTKQLFIKEIGELNTRGGAWKELIKLYDEDAILKFKTRGE